MQSPLSAPPSLIFFRQVESNLSSGIEEKQGSEDGERGRIRTCDPCLKSVAKTLTVNNLHVQLTPCAPQQNQRDANKTRV